MFKYLLTIAAMVAAVLVFNSCSKEDEISYDPYKNQKDGQEFLENNGKREGVVTTNSGLQYEVISAGREDGKKPTATSSVQCNYTGTFINGKTFDSSNGTPIVFPLNGVIRGWTEGLQYMKEGAKYRFFIPYNLAYGPSGYHTIPPYSTLIFEVELIKVID